MPDSLLLAAGNRREFSPGSWAGTGAFSVAAIVKRTGWDTLEYAWLCRTEGSPDVYLLGLNNLSSGMLSTYDGTTERRWDPTMALSTADQWYLFGISKAAGTTTPRGHAYQFSTDTWEHGNFNGTLPNNAAPTSIIWGEVSGESLVGNMLIGGLWDSVLSDAEFETLHTGMAAWIDAAPDEAVRFNSGGTVLPFVGTSSQVGSIGGSLDTDWPTYGDNPVHWTDLVPRGHCIALDDWARADQDLTTPWEAFADWDDMQIISGNVWGDADPSGSIYTSREFNDDQFVEAYINSFSGTNNDSGMGVMLRASDSVENTYTAVVNADGEIAVGKWIAGSYTSLGIFSVGFTAAGFLRFEAEGTTLRVFHNGRFAGQVTDAAIAGGYPGVCRINTSGVSIDQWVAGNLQGGPSITSVVQVEAFANGSETIYVPEDTTYAVAFYSHWDPTPGPMDPPAINSVTFDHMDTTLRGDSFGGCFVMPAPDTGEQLLEWNWTAGGNQDEGGQLVLVFLKDVHTSPIRDARLRTADTVGGASVTIDTESDDFVLVYDSVYNAGGSVNPNPYQYTLINNSICNSQTYDVAQVAPGLGSTTTVSAGSTSYPCVIAISFPNVTSTENFVYLQIDDAANDGGGKYESATGTWPPSVDGSYTDFQGATGIDVYKDDEGATSSDAEVAFVRFDTSSIPDGAVITSAQLKLYTTNKNDSNNVAVVGDYYDFGGGVSTGADWIESASPSIFTAKEIDDIVVDDVLTLELTDLAGINDSGYTGIRLTLESYAVVFNHDTVGWAAFENTSYQAPRLRVSYVTELDDTGLAVRYYLDEAASGTAPTTVEDSGPLAYDLTTVNYDTADMEWVEDGGNRGLRSITLEAGQRALREIEDWTPGDAFRTAISGIQKCVFEIVAEFGAGTSNNARVFCVNNNTGAAPEIGITMPASGATFAFFLGQEEIDQHDPPGGRVVVHCVLDTTQATQNDRLKFYIDGADVGSTNAVLNLNDTFTPVDEDIALLIFNRSSSGNYNRAPGDTTLYYAAIYTNVDFDAARVADHYAILSLDDDGPPGGPEPTPPTFIIPMRMI